MASFDDRDRIVITVNELRQNGILVEGMVNGVFTIKPCEALVHLIIGKLNNVLRTKGGDLG